MAENRRNSGHFSSKSGSAMVAAIFIAVVIGLWMAATLQSSFTEYKMSKRYLDMQSAMNLAESGLEEGIRAFNAGDWTGWTSYSNGYFKEETPNWLSNGLTGSIKIYVTKSATSPSVAAEGSVVDMSGMSIRKQVKVELEGSSLFANGLLARNQVIFNGNNVLVDSYDSRLGVYTPSSYANRNSDGSIASLSLANTDIMVNNADIRGYVATGASTWNNNVVGPNGSVHEYGYTGGKIDASRITTDFYAELPAVAIPNYASYTEMNEINSDVTLGISTDSSPRGYQAERVSLSGSKTITIDGPVRLYVRRNFSMSGNAQITITNNGSLELYVVESLSISGNGLANNTQKPEKVMIYGASPYLGGQSVDLGGNAQLYAVVYAPNAEVHLHGGGSAGTMHGAIVGNRISLVGHWGFHYDEALRDLNGGGGLSIKLWRELREAGERLPFDAPSTLPNYF